MQTTKIITVALFLFIQSVHSSHAMVVRKVENNSRTAQQVPFRNALTDVSLTSLKPDQAEESGPFYPDFRHGDNRDTGKPPLVHAHGKHVAGIVFLSLAGTFLLLGLLSLNSGRSSRDSSGNNVLAALCAFPVIGFGIPGFILLHRYPTGKSSYED